MFPVTFCPCNHCNYPRWSDCSLLFMTFISFNGKVFHPTNREPAKGIKSGNMDTRTLGPRLGGQQTIVPFSSESNQFQQKHPPPPFSFHCPCLCHRHCYPCHAFCHVYKPIFMPCHHPSVLILPQRMPWLLVCIYLYVCGCVSCVAGVVKCNTCGHLERIELSLSLERHRLCGH